MEHGGGDRDGVFCFGLGGVIEAIVTGSFLMRQTERGGETDRPRWRENDAAAEKQGGR